MTKDKFYRKRLMHNTDESDIKGLGENGYRWGDKFRNSRRDCKFFYQISQVTSKSF